MKDPQQSQIHSGDSAKEIYKRSPTRVDLAGGTLDCWPLYLFLDDPVTVNVAIDIYTHCHLRPRADQKIGLQSDDMNVEKTFASLSDALADPDPAFLMHQTHLRHWRPKQGFDLRTRSESPVGAGLGGSSSLCISMIKAFTEWLRVSLTPLEMVLTAANLEAQMLGKPTGTQDYFPPIFGGLNFISYGIKPPQVEIAQIPAEVWADRFLLVYTGRSHHSGINNWQVIKNYLDGDERPKTALKKLAVISKEMQSAVREKRFDDFSKLFAREYAARTELSDGFSSPEIRKLQELAVQAGASAKICGAGGGGCVLIWSPDRRATAIGEQCTRAGFQVLKTMPCDAELGADVAAQTRPAKKS